jgi:two-component system, NtrC family, response regulator AtoC
MPAHPLQPALNFLSEGRFSAALGAFGATAPTDALHQAAYAEALCEVGETDKASETAYKVIKKAPGAAALSVAHRVVATVLLERGDRRGALEHLAQAVSVAASHGEAYEGARASLRLFTLHHSATGRADSSQALESAKRLVLRANDPILLADLHSRVGQAEAQSGSLVSAKQHLRRSIELLSVHPHFGVLARTRLALSSTLALLCDNKSAAAEAKSALAAADEAGCIGLARLCRANVAQLLLRTGDLQDSRAVAETLLRSGPLPAHLRLAVLETYVAAVLEHETPTSFAEADEFLECMGALNDPTWIKIEAIPTQARVLKKRGASSIAREVVSAGRAQAAFRQKPDSVCRLALLEAELAISEGETEVGSRLVCEAVVAAGPLPSAELVALIERARGVAAAAAGMRRFAKLHLRRAERVLLGCGLRTEARRTRELRRGGLLYPRSRPQADTKKSFALLEAFTEARYVASLAAYPTLMAAELTHVLQAMNVSAQVSNVQASAGHALSIFCGDSAGCAVYVNFAPPGGYVAHARLQALTATIADAVDRVFRNSKQELYAGFFGIDNAPDAKHGLYISAPMRALLGSIRQIARSDFPVLVTGETGTGKEVVAKELHASSPRAQKPFIAFNVTAMPREMLEGQLFGYRRGAYTGAVSDNKGLIREAEGGTLFIDEIGELSADLQPKLLRFLESGEIQPLGERPQSVDVRIVAATNASLEHLVREGRFREDLFYRLNVIQLSIPPLRDRREEIPTLVHHFLARHAQDAGKPIPHLSPQALECLSAYAWPGNVRQLTNELKRLVALTDEDDTIEVSHLAAHIRVPQPAERPTRADDENSARVRLDQTLQGMYDEIDRIAIPWALRASRNNQRLTAQRLGLTRKGLYLKRLQYGLMPQASR